jgi:hypothetical protein
MTMRQALVSEISATIFNRSTFEVALEAVDVRA